MKREPAMVWGTKHETREAAEVRAFRNTVDKVGENPGLFQVHHECKGRVVSEVMQVHGSMLPFYSGTVNAPWN